VRWQIASIAPTEIMTPNSSVKSSLMSRGEIRFRAVNATTVAWPLVGLVTWLRRPGASLLKTVSAGLGSMRRKPLVVAGVAVDRRAGRGGDAAA